ncbi:SdiA-regulated domain-containing protein [Ideonella sp.]|uniref:SdiA-regulated domain-containing protein n=1 Tax=Ideonella sp. TaxID=1929293 RepID=UPI0035B116C4
MMRPHPTWWAAVPIAVCCVAALAGVGYVKWPTATAVSNADKADAFGENLSGLFYQPAANAQAPVLWAVQNSPARLYNLTAKGKLFVKRTDNGWGSGKTLRYPNGSGAPDAEGVTMAELGTSAVYVSTERDGDGKNRFSVLRYDVGASGSTLKATHEWNLTADLPRVNDSNLGLEGIAWVPDSHLVAKGFIDENTHLPYDPADYNGHGTGLFFVGLEDNGRVYAYALNHGASSYVRIASFASGQDQVMDLSFDRDNGILWAYCDDGCDNRSTLLAIDTQAGSPTQGRFVVRQGYNRPGSMPNTNNEGIAIAPESECADGLKGFFWADDSKKGGHALRRGTVPCGPLF